MDKKKKGPDIIDKVLEASYQHQKDSLFIMSLMHQYEERGFLTKKQMQGLHSKASKIADMNPGLLATLQATIDKLPTRDKSPIVIKKEQQPALQYNRIVEMMETILAKYPQHKTVLAIKFQYSKKHELTATEIAALEKFHKLLV